MSKWQTYARNAVCPFFRAAYERTIRCEGIIQGTVIASTYSSFSACREHVKTVCSDIQACKDCPLYRSIEKK